MEHPSLLKKKSSLESLGEIKSEIELLNSKTASLRETLSGIEQEFQSLDVLTVIADVQSKIDAFTAKYEGVLDKIEANVDAERELLAKAQAIVG